MCQDGTGACGPGIGWCSPAQWRVRVSSPGLRLPLLRRGQRCAAGSETVVCSTRGHCQGHGWQPQPSLFSCIQRLGRQLSAGVRGLPGLSGPGSQSSAAPCKLCCDSRQFLCLPTDSGMGILSPGGNLAHPRSRPRTLQASGSRESESGWRLQPWVGRVELAFGLVPGMRPEGRGCSTGSPEQVGGEGARG